MKKFFQNKVAVSSIIALMVIAIIILIFSLVNAKYTSSFNSTINLESDPPVVDKFYIIADPYECHTSSSGETGAFTHFGYYDTTPGAEDPYANLTYVEGLAPGNTVSINNTPPTSETYTTLVDQGGWYSLQFPSAAKIHYAGSETESQDRAFGALANWYDYQYNLIQTDEHRWVDNRNYIFDDYARRWAFAPTSAVSFVDGNWQISTTDPNFYIIDPSTPFSVPTGATSGFFIAYYTAHWDANAFTHPIEAWTQVEISNQLVHWDRYNVDYQKDSEGIVTHEPDDVWFEAASGSQEAANDHMYLNNSEQDPVTINGWTYDCYLSLSDRVSSSTRNGPRFLIHNENNKLIKSICLVMTVEAGATQYPIIKLDNHDSQQSIFVCSSLSQAQKGNNVYRISASSGTYITDVSTLDLFINGDGCSTIKIWGIYIDWNSNNADMPYYRYYTDGLFAPEIETFIDLIGGNSNNQNIRLSTLNQSTAFLTLDNSRLWANDKTMLSLFCVKNDELAFTKIKEHKEQNNLLKKKWHQKAQT